MSLVAWNRLSWLPVNSSLGTNYPATSSSEHSRSAPVRIKVTSEEGLRRWGKKKRRTIEGEEYKRGMGDERTGRMGKEEATCRDKREEHLLQPTLAGCLL